MEFELLQGDSVMLLRDIPSGSIDAIITDPPYNSGGPTAASRAKTPGEKYQNSDTKRVYAHFDGDQRDQVGFAFWCHQWLTECRRVAKDGAPILLFSDWRQLPLMTSILQSADFIWRGIAVWDKTGGCRPQLGRFAAQTEFVVWGSKGAMPITGKPLPGCFTHVVRQADKHHVTGKPTALMMDLVRICPEGGTILDPFAGSGTTLVAAERSGRGFIGMERESANIEIARRRLDEARAAMRE